MWQASSMTSKTYTVDDRCASEDMARSGLADYDHVTEAMRSQRDPQGRWNRPLFDHENEPTDFVAKPKLTLPTGPDADAASEGDRPFPCEDRQGRCGHLGQPFMRRAICLRSGHFMPPQSGCAGWLPDATRSCGITLGFKNEVHAILHARSARTSICSTAVVALG